MPMFRRFCTACGDRADCRGRAGHAAPRVLRRELMVDVSVSTSDVLEVHDFHAECWYGPIWGTPRAPSTEETNKVASGMRVGDRLRAIRRQKGLSLHDVEARSNMEFKASVLGAYERGERAISVPRLLRLSEIYEVPSDQLLPRELDGAEISLVEAGTAAPVDLNAGFTIDLVRLHDLDDPDAAVLSRYATTIQLERQDFNGRLLTIRRDDLRILAAVLGRSIDEMAARFDELGLRAGAGTGPRA